MNGRLFVILADNHHIENVKKDNYNFCWSLGKGYKLAKKEKGRVIREIVELFRTECQDCDKIKNADFPEQKNDERTNRIESNPQQRLNSIS